MYIPSVNNIPFLFVEVLKCWESFFGICWGFGGSCSCEFRVGILNTVINDIQQSKDVILGALRPSEARRVALRAIRGILNIG
jgi:hypothetical protein